MQIGNFDWKCRRNGDFKYGWSYHKGNFQGNGKIISTKSDLQSLDVDFRFRMMNIMHQLWQDWLNAWGTRAVPILQLIRQIRALLRKMQCEILKLLCENKYFCRKPLRINTCYLVLLLSSWEAEWSPLCFRFERHTSFSCITCFIEIHQESHSSRRTDAR